MWLWILFGLIEEVSSTNTLYRARAHETGKWNSRLVEQESVASIVISKSQVGYTRTRGTIQR